MELSPAQREHWEKQLANAERAVEVARRMLGYKAIELSTIEGINLAGAVAEDHEEV